MIEMRATFIQRQPSLKALTSGQAAIQRPVNDNYNPALPAGRIINGMGGMIEEGEHVLTGFENFYQIN